VNVDVDVDGDERWENTATRPRALRLRPEESSQRRSDENALSAADAVHPVDVDVNVNVHARWPSDGRRGGFRRDGSCKAGWSCDRSIRRSLGV